MMYHEELDVFFRKLEKYIFYFDKVFLVRPKNEKEDRLALNFVKYISHTENKTKVLFLTNRNNFYEDVCCEVLTDWEIDHAKQLYMMYEFSNRFQVLFCEDNFGSLHNYLETGILTEEEVFQALLQ